jgi:hypothetical protein
LIYQTELTVPYATNLPITAEKEVLLVDGKVTQVEVMFPPGSCGLLGVAIFYHQHRLWPSSPDSWFYADNYTFRWNEELRIDEQPFALRVVGYNNDDVYNHTVIVRFAMTTTLLSIDEYLRTLLGPQRQITG